MEETLRDVLQLSVFENPLSSYLIAFGILLVGWLSQKRLIRFVCRSLYRVVFSRLHGVPYSELLRLLRDPLELFLFVLLIYFALDRLNFPPNWEIKPRSEFGVRMVLHKCYLMAVLVTATWLGVRVIKLIGLVFVKIAEETESKLDDQFTPFFRDLVILLFVISMMFVMLSKIFEIDVLTLVASLGIGGLALALAARQTLENLFASFALMIDRPFTLGDAVRVDGIEGTIEKVGFWSTRLRTFDGSKVTLPNQFLTSRPLDNLTQRNRRRARFPLRLSYETPQATIERIMQEIRERIEAHEKTNVEPHTVRFDVFNESSLDILVVYFVETSDYREFMAVKEEINREIRSIVENNGAKFAFPRRELYFRASDADTAHEGSDVPH
jgi:MscS family membrane protein